MHATFSKMFKRIQDQHQEESQWEAPEMKDGASASSRPTTSPVSLLGHHQRYAPSMIVREMSEKLSATPSIPPVATATTLSRSARNQAEKAPEGRGT